MKLTLCPDALVEGLQQVIGVIERRLTLPILSNILCSISEGTLQLTATDLEVEIESFVSLPEPLPACQFTVPGRKFLDVCKSLPGSDPIEVSHENQRVSVKTGSGCYVLSTLPATDFPNIDDDQPQLEFNITQSALKELIERTHYAMAEQDVRFYLNGMLWEVDDGVLHAAAIDGHRLSHAWQPIACGDLPKRSVLVPHKGIIELGRLLDKSEEVVTVSFCANHVSIASGNVRFRSKLIDGAFPDFRRLMHSVGKRTLAVDRQNLKQALSRVAILTDMQNKGVRLEIKRGILRLNAVSGDQDEAWEELPIQYEGEPTHLGFNVQYVTDILSVITSDQVTLHFENTDVATLLEGDAAENAAFVIMPLRL